MKKLQNLIHTTGKWGQELKDVFVDLKRTIRSIDRDRIPDPQKAIQELRKAIRSIIVAVGNGLPNLATLKERIKELQNAIDSINTNAKVRMPDMQNVFHSVGEWWWDFRNTIRNMNRDWFDGQAQNARNTIRDMDVLTVDKAAEIIAGLGVPGLILTVLMAASPWYGAAAMTSALAILGGPLGMAGGIVMLPVLALIAKSFAKFGFIKVFKEVFINLKKSGKTREEILEKIDSSPISNELKKKLREIIEESTIENNKDDNNGEVNCNQQ